jgi:hypothetical protein
MAIFLSLAVGGPAEIDSPSALPDTGLVATQLPLSPAPFFPSEIRQIDWAISIGFQ